MNKIFIVRHGQDQDNANGILNGRRDTELTALGRKQAGIVAKKMKSHKIDIIYSSPLKRAYETARIIAQELGIDEIIADAHLVERDFGILTGKLIKDIPKYATKTMQGHSFLFLTETEGSEEFPVCMERAGKILQEITNRHPGKNILIVCHGDIGKMIQAVYHKWSWEYALSSTPYMDNTGVLELSPDADKVE